MLRQIDSFDEDAAGSGLQNAQNHIDGGGFSRSVRSQQTDDFAAVDLERNSVDGSDIPVIFSQLLH
jgi:hypothetical protein